MEERKAKMGFTVGLFLGILFAFLGGIYVVMAVTTLLWKADMPFMLSFGGVGLGFVTAGMIFLCTDLARRRRNNRLLSGGNYIMAEITEIERCFYIRVNRRYPYVVICRYQDACGTVHLFKSCFLFFDPTALLKDNSVRVYVERDHFKHYYVDIDEILPRVIEH